MGNGFLQGFGPTFAQGVQSTVTSLLGSRMRREAAVEDRKQVKLNRVLKLGSLPQQIVQLETLLKDPDFSNPDDQQILGLHLSESRERLKNAAEMSLAFGAGTPQQALGAASTAVSSEILRTGKLPENSMRVLEARQKADAQMRVRAGRLIDRIAGMQNPKLQKEAMNATLLPIMRRLGAGDDTLKAMAKLSGDDLINVLTGLREEINQGLTIQDATKMLKVKNEAIFAMDKLAAKGAQARGEGLPSETGEAPAQGEAVQALQDNARQMAELLAKDPLQEDPNTKTAIETLIKQRQQLFRQGQPPKEQVAQGPPQQTLKGPGDTVDVANRLIEEDMLTPEQAAQASPSLELGQQFPTVPAAPEAPPSAPQAAPRNEIEKLSPIQKRINDAQESRRSMLRGIREAEIRGDAADARTREVELRKITSELRDLEEQARADAIESAPLGQETQVSSLMRMQKRVSDLTQRIDRIDASDLPLEAKQKRIAAIQDQRQKALAAMQSMAAKVTDANLEEVMREVGIDASDPVAVTQVLNNPQVAKVLFNLAENRRIEKKVKDLAQSERTKIRFIGSGSRRRVVQIDPKAKGGFKDLGPGGKALFITVPSGSRIGVMEMLRMKIAGIKTNVKQIDELTPEAAEKLLSKLASANPIALAIAGMLEEGGGLPSPPPSQTPESQGEGFLFGQ